MNVQEKALSLIQRCEIGMLGNKDENGNPQIKAMMKTKNEGLNTFWFCSNTSARRSRQIKEDGNVCLYFYSEKDYEGVMLRGRAELSYDDDMRQAFWQDFMRVYYPQGPLDPDFVLIKFTATSGNYYHELNNEDFDINATLEDENATR